MPVHEFMQAAKLIYHLVPRTNVQMVCIAKLHLAFEVSQIKRGYPTLYRGGCSYVHKHRGLNDAVNGRKLATASGALLLQ